MGLTTKRYSIPVYEPSKQGKACRPSEAPDDAPDYVTVTVTGDQCTTPGIYATVHRYDRTTRYRFRVTDPDRGWCAYIGEHPTTIPVVVHHAVHACGYDIENVRTITDWEIMSLTTKALADSIGEHLTGFSDTALLRAITRYVRNDLQTLSSLLLGRALLADDAYWLLWDEPHANSLRSQEFRQELVNWIEHTSVDDPQSHLLFGEGGPTGLTTFRGLTADDADLLVVGLVTGSGVTRFQFQHTDMNVCVSQNAADPLLKPPPQVIARLADEGYQVLDTLWTDVASTPVDAAERVVAYCDELPTDELIPETAGKEGNIVRIARRTATIAGLLYSVWEVAERDANQTNDQLCEQLEETFWDGTDDHVAEQLLPMFFRSLPDDTLGLVKTYLDERPALSSELITEHDEY